MSDVKLTDAWGAIGEEETTEKKAPKDKLEYLALKGSVRIRVLDAAPHAYQQWWAPKGNGGRGTSIPYKGRGKDLLEKENQEFLSQVFAEADRKRLEGKARKDFLRDEGYRKLPWGKLKQKYVIHVLDRADGKVKLLDRGPKIFKELKALVLNPEYGDLRQYDITITVTGDDWHEIDYAVTPARSNTPLSPEEIQLYESKKVDLAELKSYKDLTPEQCLWIARGGKWDDLQAHKEKTTQQQAAQETTSSVEKPQTTTNQITSPARELTPEELENLEF